MIKSAFFGSSQFSVYILEELEMAGFVPAVVVSTPDKPVGRKQIMTPTPVSDWATHKQLPTIKSAKLNGDFVAELKEFDCNLFIVASYGKIIPQSVLDLPAHKTLNVHPSLLPKYRGPSPLQAVMLDNSKETGVTIMRIDAEMDHGPVVAQEKVTVNEWLTYEKFEEMMARKGGQLLAKVIPEWVAGKISEKEQDHSQATYTKKITKEDGLIDLTADPYENFRKIQAYHEWPQAYFFIEKTGKKLRVKITEAEYSQDKKLVIKKVIPEGSKEMSRSDFERGFMQSPL